MAGTPATAEGNQVTNRVTRTCIQSRARERSLAEHVFHVEPDAMRMLCRRTTPLLALHIVELNPEINRVVNWQFTVGGDQSW